MGTEEAIAKALQYTTEESKIEMFSDLSDEEIHDIALALTVAQEFKKIYKTDMFVNLIKNYLKLKVSRNRKGRDEVVNLITYQNIMGGGKMRGTKLSDLFGGMK